MNQSGCVRDAPPSKLSLEFYDFLMSFTFTGNSNLFSPWISWRTNCSPRLFQQDFCEGLKSSTGVIRMVLCKAFQSSFYGYGFRASRTVSFFWRKAECGAIHGLMSDDLFFPLNIWTDRNLNWKWRSKCAEGSGITKLVRSEFETS